jgi:hypothetical protein
VSTGGAVSWEELSLPKDNLQDVLKNCVRGDTLGSSLFLRSKVVRFEGQPLPGYNLQH